MGKKTKPKKAQTKQQQIATAILGCQDSRGNVIPTLVVEAARNPSSILHDEFNWNIAEAAQAHWEERAKELIRKARLVFRYEDRRILVPYYVHDPRRKSSAYIPSDRATKSAALSSEVLQQELGRIRAAIQRAKTLAAYFDLESSFDRMLQDLIEIETNLGFDDNGRVEARP